MEVRDAKADVIDSAAEGSTTAFGRGDATWRGASAASTPQRPTYRIQSVLRLTGEDLAWGSDRDDRPTRRQLRWKTASSQSQDRKEDATPYHTHHNAHSALARMMYGSNG